MAVGNVLFITRCKPLKWTFTPHVWSWWGSLLLPFVDLCFQASAPVKLLLLLWCEWLNSLYNWSYIIASFWEKWISVLFDSDGHSKLYICQKWQRSTFRPTTPAVVCRNWPPTRHQESALARHRKHLHGNNCLMSTLPCADEWQEIHSDTGST